MALIDSKLMDSALKTGGLKSKKDTDNQAMREFIKRRKSAEIIELFGAVEYDSAYNHKDARKFR